MPDPISGSTIELDRRLAPADEGPQRGGPQSGGTIDIYPAQPRQLASPKRFPFARALTIATVLGFAKAEEQVFLPPSRDRFWTTTPYLTLLDEGYNYDDLIPTLGFTLGAPRIVVPKRVRLSPEALRSLALGRLVMGPLSIDVEEL